MSKPKPENLVARRPVTGGFSPDKCVVEAPPAPVDPPKDDEKKDDPPKT